MFEKTRKLKLFLIKYRLVNNNITIYIDIRKW